MTYRLCFRRGGYLVGSESIEAVDDDHAVLIARTRHLGDVVEVGTASARIVSLPIRALGAPG